MKINICWKNYLGQGKLFFFERTSRAWNYLKYFLPRVQQTTYNIFSMKEGFNFSETRCCIQDSLEKKLFFSSVATAAKSTALSPLLANRNQYFHNMALLWLVRARCTSSAKLLFLAIVPQIIVTTNTRK